MSLKLALVGVLIVFLGVWHYYDKKAAGEAVKTSMVAEYQKNLDKSVQEAIETTKELQKQADALKDKKYEKLQSINAQLASDYRSLQQRSKRPPDTPQHPSTGSSCTAAQLYREDAEFLAGEAARAESVLIERDYYYERYESIRKGMAPH